MQNGQNPILLIDTMGLVHTLFKEKDISLNSQGKDRSVIRKSLSTVKSLIKVYQPKYVVLALESKTVNFRKEIYPLYKANRKERNPLLSQQIPAIIDMFTHIGFPIYYANGYEADDVIGTLAKQLSTQGHKVIIYSKDKDFVQLIDDNISVSIKHKELLITHDKYNGHEKFDVPIQYTIDALAISGDDADNIPGVKGMGKNSAATLINKYGGINDIYSSIDDGSFNLAIGKRNVKETIQLLQESREDVFLSYELATIKTDIKFDEEVTLDKLSIKACNFMALYQLFKDWEIDNLIEKFVKKDYPFLYDSQEVSTKFSELREEDELRLKELKKQAKIQKKKEKQQNRTIQKLEANEERTYKEETIELCVSEQKDIASPPQITSETSDTEDLNQQSILDNLVSKYTFDFEPTDDLVEVNTHSDIILEECIPQDIMDSETEETETQSFEESQDDYQTLLNKVLKANNIIIEPQDKTHPKEFVVQSKQYCHESENQNIQVEKENVKDFQDYDLFLTSILEETNTQEVDLRVNKTQIADQSHVFEFNTNDMEQYYQDDLVQHIDDSITIESQDIDTHIEILEKEIELTHFFAQVSEEHKTKLKELEKTMESLLKQKQNV